jgi:hypothetical protein
MATSSLFARKMGDRDKTSSMMICWQSYARITPLTFHPLMITRRRRSSFSGGWQKIIEVEETSAA